MIWADKPPDKEQLARVVRAAQHKVHSDTYTLTHRWKYTSFGARIHTGHIQNTQHADWYQVTVGQLISHMRHIHLEGKRFSLCSLCENPPFPGGKVLKITQKTTEIWHVESVLLLCEGNKKIPFQSTGNVVPLGWVWEWEAPPAALWLLLDLALEHTEHTSAHRAWLISASSQRYEYTSQRATAFQQTVKKANRGAENRWLK